MSITMTVLGTRALQDIGVVDPGETPSTDELNQALDVANSILDNWSMEGKMALSELITTFATVANTQGYTIGPAMTISMARPVRVNGAEVIMTNGPNMPIRVLQSAAEWDSLEDRASISFWTKFLFYDRGYPTGNLYLSPVPRGCANIEIATWVALTQFADLTTPITLLPGYERALRLMMAHDLCGKFSMNFSKENAESLQMALTTLITLNDEHVRGIIPPTGTSQPMGKVPTQPAQ